ncbi:uncharacterized protein LOC110082782 isoform X1 [Pogona vitticeps]
MISCSKLLISLLFIWDPRLLAHSRLLCECRHFLAFIPPPECALDPRKARAVLQKGRRVPALPASSSRWAGPGRAGPRAGREAGELRDAQGPSRRWRWLVEAGRQQEKRGGQPVSFLLASVGAEEQEVPNRPASGHGGLLSRLSRLEAEVQYLSQELRAEKLLWSSRYLELLREQQGLLAQLQGQDQTLWLQDLEGQTDAWGPPDGPRGPSDPGSTARGVGTQTGEEGAAGPRRHRDVPGQQGAWSRLPPT